MDIVAPQLKEAWDKYQANDYLTDDELYLLQSSAEEGRRYLQARGERLAGSKTTQDLVKIGA